jgi:hypothetical protein
MIDEEPCAEIIYEFIQYGQLISGRYMVAKRSDAVKQIERLNDIYGEGSHYINVHNITYKEWLESFK